MTNHYIDLKNSDVILIMGSNAAENHPIAFKWIMRAKDAGARVIHVDPRCTRTSARCDYHVPIRSGTDIAFLGGMIKRPFKTSQWATGWISSQPVFEHQVGHTGEFTGVVRDDDQTLSAGYRGDLQIVRADGQSLTRQDRPNVTEVGGGIAGKGQARQPRQER